MIERVHNFMPNLPHFEEIESLLSNNPGQVVVVENGLPKLETLQLLEGIEVTSTSKILVTGGAGYIGSHTVSELRKQGFEIIILDDLSTGHAQAVGANLIQGNLLDKELLEKVFTENNIVVVIHFAGAIRVEESVQDPDKYFLNNVQTSINLLNVMLKHHVSKLVYSSSAAVYGSPARIPIQEGDPTVPTNPYGESKLLVEKIIHNYHDRFGLSAVIFRYFNAAGASLDCFLGESHPIETHLIPKILDVAIGKDESLKVFGNDYPTRDGSAVRDYVHVVDLARAHVAAVQKLAGSAGVFTYNIGTGTGYSIMQVIQESLEVTRKMIVCEVQPRRPGDPPMLVADSSKIKNEMNFTLEHSDLRTIIQTAWKWHKKSHNF